MPVDPFEEVWHAWAAGFMDGEGCFLATKRKDKMAVAIHLTASQVKMEPLERLQIMYGGVIGVMNRKTKGNERTVYRWGLNSAPAVRKVLPLWLPYLTTKRDEAELLLEVATLTPTRGGTTFDSAETIVQRLEIIERMKTMRNGTTYVSS